MSEAEQTAVSGAPPEETLATAPAERVLEVPDLGGTVLVAVDTALGTSVAVGAGPRVFEVTSDDRRRHAEAIGDLLARALEMSGTTSAAVTGVVAGIGPGPFTGLRVGIAAAQAFARGRRIPLLPLQGHEAVALAVLEACAADPAAGVRVVQDAKRRELFITDFAGLDADGIPVREAGPYLRESSGYEPVSIEVRPERIPAARLVQLAARRVAAGREFEEDRALYLRAPDVKMPAGPVTP